MTPEDTGHAVYPTGLSLAERLAWNLRRERALDRLPPSPEREVAISVTRDRVKLLREMIEREKLPA